MVLLLLVAADPQSEPNPGQVYSTLRNESNQITNHRTNFHSKWKARIVSFFSLQKIRFESESRITVFVKSDSPIRIANHSDVPFAVKQTIIRFRIANHEKLSKLRIIG